MKDNTGKTTSGIARAKPTLNIHLFKQIGLDSGALTMLGTIVHNLPHPGAYHGTVVRGEEIRARFEIAVDENAAAGQVNIDLALLDDPFNGCGRKKFTVHPKGAIVFHVSKGPGGYYVIIDAAGGEKCATVFDSRKLDNGDVFVATVLRPGEYRVTNALDRHTARLEVPYPERREVALCQRQPLTINCTGKGFEPGEIHAKVAQAQAYLVKAPARIVIELSKPFDRSKDEGPRKTRFMKPGLGGPVQSESPKKTGK